MQSVNDGTRGLFPNEANKITGCGLRSRWFFTYIIWLCLDLFSNMRFYVADFMHSHEVSLSLFHWLSFHFPSLSPFLPFPITRSLCSLITLAVSYIGISLEFEVNKTLSRWWMITMDDKNNNIEAFWIHLFNSKGFNKSLQNCVFVYPSQFPNTGFQNDNQRSKSLLLHDWALKPLKKKKIYAHL